MATRIRLKRLGRKGRAFYRMGVFDSRTRRNGRALEELGHYDPHLEIDKKYVLKRERIEHWLGLGALPSETVQAILLSQGIDVPTSGKKRALTPEERVEKDRLKEIKRKKREEAKQRKEAIAATATPMSKAEKRAAKRAGG
ncbi:MAG: 30S ribosomal protein S16 [Planctomycetes bacterium]|nr:30S ribosomal protein S16 [Planctomycetota bacterium]